MVLAARGARKMNGAEEPLGDEASERRLQSQARWIYFESAIAALILTGLSFFFASIWTEAARSFKDFSLQQTGEFLIKHGYSLLFGWVLLEQIGLPIPAIPLLLAAGALAGSGKMNLTLAVSLALIAVILADLFWYFLGRYRGGGILKLLCRIFRTGLVRSANGESFRPAWRSFFARCEICTRPEHRGAVAGGSLSHTRAAFHDAEQL
ncbi:MAG TPA: hypothetical protein VHM64_12890 [Candidatus Binatia bacterium]|nr:hypothetical protein [Candidatus Binatia bacterium]